MTCHDELEVDELDLVSHLRNEIKESADLCALADQRMREYAHSDPRKWISAFQEETYQDARREAFIEVLELLTGEPFPGFA